MTAAAPPFLLHDFFRKAAQRWPDNIALDIPEGAAGRPQRGLLTYAELARQSGDLAQRLGAFIPGECVVAILLPRHSPQLFISQLAVLQAGAAYTCLDPGFPDARIREMLQDSAAVALLTDGPGAARLPHRLHVGRHQTNSAGGSFPRAAVAHACLAGLHHLHLGHHRPSQGGHDRTPRHRQSGGR